MIGGLFAVIALNFTVNQAYAVLSTGDNPVNRLFALNYVALFLALMINVLFYRFNVVEKLFGRWVQEQVYLFLTWAIHLLVFAMAGPSLTRGSCLSGDRQRGLPLADQSHRQRRARRQVADGCRELLTARATP